MPDVAQAAGHDQLPPPEPRPPPRRCVPVPPHARIGWTSTVTDSPGSAVSAAHPASRTGCSGSAGWKYSCTTSRLRREPVLTTRTRAPGGPSPSRSSAAVDGGHRPGRRGPVRGGECGYQSAGRLDVAEQGSGHRVPGLLARQARPQDGVDVLEPWHEHRRGRVDHHDRPRCGRGNAPDEFVLSPGRRGGAGAVRAADPAIIVYLYIGQFLSKQRTAQALAELFGIPLSSGTVAGITARAAGRFLEHARGQIAGSEVAGFDETGFRVEGRLHWVHCARTGKYTLLTVHPKRGTEAIKGDGRSSLVRRGRRP